MLTMTLCWQFVQHSFFLPLILGDGNASGGSIGLPDFDHKNLTDWLHKRNATNAPLNTDYVSLLRKCE